MNKRRALVTGATGFVGQNLVRHLSEAGWRVHAIVRPKSDCSILVAQDYEIKLHEHEGSTESMQRILSKTQPDVVFHLASLVLSEHQPADVEQLIQSNLQLGTQLVEAMTQVGTTNLVNTGTSWQHYQSEGYNPVNLYAATKQAFEALLQYYVDARDLRATTLKLYDTYGPNDPRSKLLNLLINAARTCKPLALSPGEQQIDLVHVDDVVRAYLRAADYLIDQPEAGYKSFSVCTGKPLTIRQLVTLIERISNRKLDIHWGGRPYRDREVMVPIFAHTALPEWGCRVDLEDGIRKMWRS